MVMSKTELIKILLESIRSNNLNGVKYALEKGADANMYAKAQTFDRSKVLHLACEISSAEIVRCLIDAGADVNKDNDHGHTPLHLACWRDSLDIIKFLLNTGADVNAKSAGGYTPLHEACVRDYLDIIKLLLNAGADPTIKNNKGQTPLMCASSKECKENETIKFLKLKAISSSNNKIDAQALKDELNSIRRQIDRLMSNL